MAWAAMGPVRPPARQVVGAARSAGDDEASRVDLQLPGFHPQFERSLKSCGDARGEASTAENAEHRAMQLGARHARGRSC